VSWQWDFGDNNSSLSENPIYTYADTGTYNVQLIVEATNGCIDTSEQMVDVFLCTSISDPAQDFSVRVYPNPASETLNISYSSSVSDYFNTLRLYDSAGRLIFDEESEGELGNSDITINIEFLPAGLYILELRSYKHSILRKTILVQSTTNGF